MSVCTCGTDRSITCIKHPKKMLSVYLVSCDGQKAARVVANNMQEAAQGFFQSTGAFDRVSQLAISLEEK